MTVKPYPRSSQFTLWIPVKVGILAFMFCLCPQARCRLSIADLPMWKGC
jgi:hypothetical protein